MCGIVGYIGDRSALEVVLDGLRRLEYRGYDSAGVALLADGHVTMRKRAGKLSNLVESIEDDPLPPSTVGMGHTRWATHGPPNDRNAHPHLDTDQDVAVIHNGIIENFAKLRLELTEAGVEFRSDTDTEVVAHLLAATLPDTDGDLAEAMRRVCRRLEGAFTLVAVAASDPDTVVGARRNSPLVVGRGQGENFLASDVSAFIAHTREAIELGQDQVVAIRREGVEVADFDGAPADIREYHVDWDASAAEKGGYDHFMLKEIAEQPRAVADTLLGRLSADGRLLLDEMRLSDQELRDVDKIIIVACGTSYHSRPDREVRRRALDPNPLRSRAGVGVSLSRSHPRPADARHRDLAVGRDHGRPHGDSPRARAGLPRSHHLQHQRSHDAAGIRRGPLHPCRSGDRGRIDQGFSHPGRRGLPRRALSRAGAGPEVRRRGRKASSTSCGECRRRSTRCWRRSSRCARSPDRSPTRTPVLFRGQQVGYPVALEGALKLKELAYMHAEGFAAGELKHGPIALIEPGMPVVVVVPPPRGRGVLHDKIIGNIQEVRARRARTIVIAEGDDAVLLYADELISIPPTPAFSSRWWRRALPRCSPRDGDRQRPRRRPAPQPREVSHGRVDARTTLLRSDIRPRDQHRHGPDHSEASDVDRLGASAVGSSTQYSQSLYSRTRPRSCRPTAAPFDR